jgi:hypothetical protein
MSEASSSRSSQARPTWRRVSVCRDLSRSVCRRGRSRHVAIPEHRDPVLELGDENAALSEIDAPPAVPLYRRRWTDHNCADGAYAVVGAVRRTRPPFRPHGRRTNPASASGCEEVSPYTPCSSFLYYSCSLTTGTPVGFQCDNTRKLLSARASMTEDDARESCCVPSEPSSRAIVPPSPRRCRSAQHECGYWRRG